MPGLRNLAPVILLLAGTGCTHLGTNISGQFTCRSPKGDCAPSRVIDDRATAGLAAEPRDGAVPDDALARARHRAGATPGDVTRTGERTLRVVFPAHVDEAGVLHEEAVAWAVVEAPHWSGALRAQSTPVVTSLIGSLRNQRADAEARGAAVPVAGTLAPDAAGSTAGDLAAEPAMDSRTPSFPFAIASPTVLPSTAVEASAGGSPPVAEGSDMPAPRHDRAPRPNETASDAQIPPPAFPPVAFPTPQAINAAKARKANANEEHR